MCGIAGVWRAQAGGDLELESLREISQLMIHRGPDDEGLWTDETRCALAFRRLAILDLSPAANQPMGTSDGRYWLVYNGEVYDFRDLRQTLESEGYSFRTRGDTEVVLYALAHWGAAALSRFNGMFALAFYDSHEQTLLLARDPVGIKPLYYLKGREGVLFASQYDQILAHPWSRSRGVSMEALGLYLRLSYIPAPYGILEGTHMLEPGTWLELSPDRGPREGRFYEFPRFLAPDLRGEEAYEAVDSAITAAVRRQLVSDVPVGAFLSGGIDSPLVAAKMREVANEDVVAFTLGTGGGQLDESTDATAYAEELGVRQIVEHATPAQALELLDDVVSACGEPFGDASIFPTLLISRLARRHVKVMLSGDGGDELFWGYPTRFGSVLSTCEDFRRPRWYRRSRWAAKKFLGLGTGHPNLSWPSVGDWYRAKHSHLDEDCLEGLFEDCPAWPCEYEDFSYRGWEPDRTAQWLRWNEVVAHLTMVLLKVDRGSMAASLEVRVPLLDREVLEAAARVDWQSCLQPAEGIGKLPLRRALAGHVRHQSSAKRGFDVPMDDWLRGPLRELFEESVVKRKELLGVPLAQGGLAALFERHLAGDGDHAWGLWPLLSLALWEDRHYACRGRGHGPRRPLATDTGE